MTWRGPVILLLQKFGRCVVGKMADAGENALFDGPGVGAVTEHVEVVVGFDLEEIAAAEGLLDVGRHVAEVGGDGDADAFG